LLVLVLVRVLVLVLVLVLVVVVLSIGAYSRFPLVLRFRAGAHILTVGNDLFSNKPWHCLPATTSAGENRS
jgi:hypothetical protein